MVVCIMLFVYLAAVCLLWLSGCEACLYDSDCYAFEQCCNGDCISLARDCPLTGAAIAGIVIALIIVCAIAVSIMSCYWCACCPWYRHRYPGAVIIPGPSPYQQFTATTTTTINPPPNQLYPQQIPPMQNPLPLGPQVHPPPYMPPPGVGPAPPHAQFVKQ